VKVIQALQPYHVRPAAHGLIQHPLLLTKELADADKHRVLPASYGLVHLGPVLRGAALSYDDAKAAGPEFKRTLPEKRQRRMVTTGTELARVRFERGNEHPGLYVAAEPIAEVVLERHVQWGHAAQHRRLRSHRRQVHHPTRWPVPSRVMATSQPRS
jgi:hypothetical protein